MSAEALPEMYIVREFDCADEMQAAMNELSQPTKTSTGRYHYEPCLLSQEGGDYTVTFRKVFYLRSLVPMPTFG